MASDADLSAHIQRIIRIHFDPRAGAPYWLERQRALGIDAIAEVRTVGDLARLGVMDAATLGARPVLDFVPLSERRNLVGGVVADTGGTTGRPKRTIFTRNEFHAAFVEPFVRMAAHAGFPRGARWLYVGPSGPHVIGQAAVACAAALGGHQPYAVDFDPRWFRKLPLDSLGRERYLQHLVDQARDVLRTESAEVLFTTPVLLKALAAVMTDGERERIIGVHYGGMRVDPELLLQAQTAWFPKAVHLAGYGNSLFGVCMEAGGASTRHLRYFPHGPRHHVCVAEDGQVWMHRLDPTVLIVNLAERDAGTLASPSPALKQLGFGEGVEDPGPRRGPPGTEPAGIY
ncbi:MAG: hypothetical protein HY763_11565 [Planctomycetes bacterium]|nr:hypothetical protein [Planctomycetota bacterium]